MLTSNRIIEAFGTGFRNRNIAISVFRSGATLPQARFGDLC